MPTFDGGHYFLTALMPVRAGLVPVGTDGQVATSAVHALRKRLSLLPTAEQSPACKSGNCPFARNKRTHFVRIFVIDDVAYNGRDPSDTLLNTIRQVSLTVAQPQDHLSCPFLVFVVDFDAESGADSERDSYLTELWNTMQLELRDLFQYCEGFTRVRDAATFAKYIAGCQLETTMSFNDYYPQSGGELLSALPAWPANAYGWAVGLAAAVTLAGLVAVLALIVACLFAASLPAWVQSIAWLSLAGAAALALAIYLAYQSVMAAGAKPFPASPDAKLPAVLKALYLQRTFACFAINQQMTAAATDSASAQELYKSFERFIQDNRPDNLDTPTQAPGVVCF